MKDKLKVVGVGACVMDTLITVPFYPKEDTKLKAVAVSKLGVSSDFLGVLSDDNGGIFLLQDFEKYGVDTSNVEVKGGYLYDGKELIHYPAFVVEAVDTNGSGDVFHGAFAAAMVKGFNFYKCCLFASATSALKCMGGGRSQRVCTGL